MHLHITCSTEEPMGEASSSELVTARNLLPLTSPVTANRQSAPRDTPILLISSQALGLQTWVIFPPTFSLIHKATSHPIHLSLIFPLDLPHPGLPSFYWSFLIPQVQILSFSASTSNCSSTRRFKNSLFCFVFCFVVFAVVVFTMIFYYKSPA